MQTPIVRNMKSPEQREKARLYAAEYRKNNPTLPKTPEQMEKRRLWQIEYRKNKPLPKPTQAQKERKAIKQREYRASIKEEKDLHKKAKQARLDANKAERMRLRQQKKEARTARKKEADRLRYLAKNHIPQTRGRKPSLVSKPKPLPARLKAKLKPMTVDTIKAIGRVLPNRVINMEALVKLQLDHKTTIYIRPDQDPEVIRQRFLNRRA